MFSFHKPKVYRSLNGCCICRAKSSSSRFTDSRRYENDFTKCFEITEKRQGEICNACVLLVKRWKKLPVGSTRNWHHVVDARAGPGTKSMNKIKKNNHEDLKCLKRKHRYKPRKDKISSAQNDDGSDGILSMFDDELEYDDDLGDGDSAVSTPVITDDSDDEEVLRDDRVRTVPGCASSRAPAARNSRKKKPPVHLHQLEPRHFSPFLDLTYWKQSKVCCGIVFEGQQGELLLDPALYRPCWSHKRPRTDSSGSSEKGAPARHQEAFDCGSSSSSQGSGAPSTADSDSDAAVCASDCAPAKKRGGRHATAAAGDDVIKDEGNSGDLWPPSSLLRSAAASTAAATALPNPSPAALELAIGATHAGLPPPAQLASPRCISMEV